MDSSYVCQVKNVSKSFPGVKALDGIDLNIDRGKVHGLVGENGAGKSTLIKILTGAYKLDNGTVDYYNNGKLLHISDTLQAKRNGISTAYQDLLVAADLTVAENFFLGCAPKNKLGMVDWRKMYAESDRILAEYDMGYVNSRALIRNLTISVQAMINIVKIANEKANMVIFDEPTALLPNEDVRKLFAIIKRMRDEGTSVLYISHRLEEVLEICDTVTVLKDGKLVDTLPISEVNEDKLVSLMVGRDIEDIYGINHPELGTEVLRVENLSRDDVFRDVNFDLKKGEIIGFFGLVGSGRTEIMRCLYGADKLTSGKIYVDGKETKISSVKDANNKKFGLIPEDRRKQGLAMPLSIAQNINMSDYDSITRFGLINRKREEQRARQFIDALNIKAYSSKQKVENLSGGNQQKVVISKILCKGGEIIIMDEPTVGVDVGAKKEIYNLIEKLVNEGKAIIFVSSYLPEVMGISDRINVTCEGHLTGTVTRQEIEKIGYTAAEEKIMKFASKVERS